MTAYRFNGGSNNSHDDTTYILLQCYHYVANIAAFNRHVHLSQLATPPATEGRTTPLWLAPGANRVYACMPISAWAATSSQQKCQWAGSHGQRIPNLTKPTWSQKTADVPVGKIC